MRNKIIILILCLILTGCGSKTYTITFNTDGGTPLENIVIKEGENIKDSDVVLYLFDLEKALINKNKSDYREDVENEIILYRDYCKEYNKPLIAIGTHLDKIKGFNDKQLVPGSDLINEIRKEDFIKKILTIVNNEICFVSLTDDYIEQSTALILEKAKKSVE